MRSELGYLKNISEHSLILGLNDYTATLNESYIETKWQWGDEEHKQCLE